MNKAFGRKRDKPSMHNPEVLVQHHVTYSAKFLGITEVDQPKGTDVVRIAVRKLKFQSHIRKSEGEKIPKVELQISIYGVKILDPKTKDILHNSQLHRMSFCADDKTDERIFAYICTELNTKKHLCYVFDSEKCAEEITVAIGQAFDLAYTKFLESGGKDVETRQQIGNFQKRIQDLEMENSKLKKQLQELEDQLLSTQASPAGSIPARVPSTDIFDMVPFTPTSPVSRIPICNVTLPLPLLSPKNRGVDLFGAEPFDPFICGFADYTPDIQSKLDEIQEGFQMGLTLEGTIFSTDQADRY
ncbi:PTB domain-containing engulfment adapter protein 1 isoform X2 [Electrophorus electricus]|nr:PTB domain-containing engulfment adapter protein 1 isoform X2 [Electrophorus electricus]XP_035383191.1 PTB domain-containing engulfment adapter protein 1 isoform X2 [Electrophorus electricus]